MANIVVIFILFVIFPFSSNSQDFQSKVLFKATSYNLYDICHISNSSVWAIGTPHWDQNTLSYRSTVLFSSDLGQTWKEKEIPYLGKFTSVFFTDINHGWITGEDGLIIKTVDGGENWNNSILDKNYKISDIFFSNNDTGYAVGYSSRASLIWKTENGGQDWQAQHPYTQIIQLNSVKFTDSQNGWICGSCDSSGRICGTILNTIDGGKNWNIQFLTPQDMTFTSLFFIDSHYGWAAGVNSIDSSGSTLFKTSDGGKSWTETSLQDKFYSLYFIDKNRGLAGGVPANSSNGPKLYRTLNGGQHWDELTVSPHTGEMIHGLWVDQNNFITVGYRSHVCTGASPWGNVILNSRQIQTRLSFNTIYFKDKNTGWVAGTKSWFDHGNQVIMRTQNGGKDWEIVYERDTLCEGYSRLFSRIRDIVVFDDKSGIAVGDIKSHTCDSKSATVLTTNDNGSSWQIMESMRDSLFSLYAINKNNIWLIPQISTNSSLYLWNGNLNNFEKKTSALQINFTGQADIFFLDEMRGWIAGGKGCIASTVDGGNNWQLANKGFGANSTCQTLCFTDELNGWIGGSDLYQTTDGGKNWKKRDDIQFDANEIFDIQFTNSQNGWLAGDMGIIMRTCNGGQNWITQQGRKENFQRIRGIHFIDDSTGWGCGDDGTIISIRSDNSNSIVSGYKTRIPSVSIKSQKYGGINVSFNSVKNDIIFLEMTDLHGRKLMRIKKRVLRGDNSIKIPAHSICKGIYILKYICSDYSFADKIILN